MSGTAENLTERLTVRVTPEEMDLIEDMAAETRDRPEMYSMSKSEIVRRGFQHAVFEAEMGLEDLAPAGALAKARGRDRHNRIRTETYPIDMVEGWPGRVETRLNRRLSDPYDPRGIRRLAPAYRAELETWVDEVERADLESYDPERIDEMLDRLDRMLEAYEVCFRIGAPRIEIGLDLLRIKDPATFSDVCHTLGDIVDRLESPTIGAVTRRIAGDYALDDTTVEYLLDGLTGDETDTRRALKTGEGFDHIRSALPGADESETLESADPSTASQTASDLDRETLIETMNIDTAEYVTAANLERVTGWINEHGEDEARIRAETEIVPRDVPNEVAEVHVDTLLEMARDYSHDPEPAQTAAVSGGGD